jgi:arylsulfatase A-like enzyme
MGTQNLRSEVPIPEMIKTIPEYLREAGYFTTNNSKTDYNFSAEGRWDENSNQAHWRNRPAGKPFFSVFNFGTTHEGNANRFEDNDPALAGLPALHDPEQAILPPYFPDTEEFRKIWAHQYDIITRMDQQAGEILQQLEEDDLLENTIIFFFSDHGFGLPRYKRWCYQSGLKVPLIIKAPEKYQHLLPHTPGSESSELVSFVDFAPSILKLAGLEVPEIMEGNPFLGEETDSVRSFVYGARDRADDVYDMSRAVVGSRYIYIRNYLPQIPYIQKAIIFNEYKRSYAELWRLKKAGQLPPHSLQFFQPKATEELYDLEVDPYELNNLAGNAEFETVLKGMRDKLHQWQKKYRDSGLLHEAELMSMAADSTAYDYLHSMDFDPETLLKAATIMGRDTVSTEYLVKLLNHPDQGVRYWAARAVNHNKNDAGELILELRKALNDSSPSVQLAAAESLAELGFPAEALPVIANNLRQQDKPTTVLAAAMVARRLDQQACELLPILNEIYSHYQGPVWDRYASWFYPMFIGMAMDQVRINCGESLVIDH